jgi:phage terminase small subunit
MNKRQQLFALEYALDPQRNATQAAIRAGYSPATARTTAYRLMKNDDVKGIISRTVQAAAENAEVTLARVIAELAVIAFCDIRAVVSWNEDGVAVRPSEVLTPAAAASVAEVRERIHFSRNSHQQVRTLTVRLHDKLKALVELARILEPTRDSSEGVKVYLAVGTRSDDSHDRGGVAVVECIPKPAGCLRHMGAG